MSHSFATVKKGGHGGSYGGATMREDYWVGAALTATISATLLRRLSTWRRRRVRDYDGICGNMMLRLRGWGARAGVHQLSCHMWAARSLDG